MCEKILFDRRARENSRLVYLSETHTCPRIISLELVSKCTIKCFVCVTDAKKKIFLFEKAKMSTNSTIDQVNNDKNVLEYSQLCLNCGIATHDLNNQTDLCKETKSFTCSACSFKCCSRNNLEYHMQNDHKVSINYAIPWDSKEREIFKSMNNFSNEGYPRRRSESKPNIDYFILFFITYVIHDLLFSC